ncbi:MAG TPA: DUF3309 domain-containing protein [Ferrovibrio sp.]|uniref:DUF3309 domain-containing protein n=1 Tax=Ferrovibrio sp. TaxID=1917215 RepID=UPI002B4B27D6|nr:DUF3309 domain-containing protein [Ferrovibrio sp.]HLT77713.1 DUF3309 domain-containing protein [Ferrovibrio sp.]
MHLIFLACLVTLLIFALPIWPYSRTWSHFPSGFVALVLLIFTAFLATGRIVS